MSDNESITSQSSQSSVSSKASSLRRRDSSKGSVGSTDSIGSSKLDWIKLSEFDDVPTAIEFVKTALAPNFARTTTYPFCRFYDKLTASKHKMTQQIVKNSSTLESYCIWNNYRICINEFFC